LIHNDESHAIAELQSLARRHPLKGADLEKAKSSMAILREAGYTNFEISNLTGGAWSEPTVKLYSRGAEVKDSSIKQAALNLLSELVAQGLSLNDVRLALFLKQDLDSAGLTPKDTSLLLSEAARVGLSLKPLVLLFEDIRKSLPVASIDDMADVTAYKVDLIRQGIGTEELQKLS